MAFLVAEGEAKPEALALAQQLQCGALQKATPGLEPLPVVDQTGPEMSAAPKRGLLAPARSISPSHATKAPPVAFLEKWELNVASWIETKNQGLIAVITVNEVVWKVSEKHA